MRPVSRSADRPGSDKDPNDASEEQSTDSVVPNVEDHAPAVLRFISRRVGNAADAADLAQHTLMLGVLHFAECRTSAVRPWLYGIARRVVADFYRARRRIVLLPVDTIVGAEAERSLQVPADDVHNRSVCHQALDDWLACIADQMHLEEQIAVLLTDLHGYANKDAAAMLGMSLASFKLLLHGARARVCGPGSVVCPLNRAVGSHADGPLDVTPRCGRRPAAPALVHRLEVACRLPHDELMAMRARLLDPVRLVAGGSITRFGRRPVRLPARRRSRSSSDLRGKSAASVPIL
jgi:RNA polymerase sigma factor (sigma-70 family)